MSAAPALPACPRCPDRTLQPFSADGSRLICTGCSRTYRAGNLEEDRSVDDLVRQCLSEDRRRGQHGGGGSRSKSRTTPKAGELEAKRQARRERRYFDQPTGAIGARDNEVLSQEPLRRNVQGWVGAEQATFVDAFCDAANVKQSDMVRLGLAALRDRAARGGVPCQQCGMPLVDSDENCPGCGG